LDRIAPSFAKLRSVREQHARTEQAAELELVVLGDDELTTFIADALAFENVELRRAGSIDQVTDWIEHDRDRWRMVIVDVDGTSAIDQLFQIRERGFRGELVAIGSVAPEIAMAMGVSCVLGSRLTSRELKRVVRAALGTRPDDAEPPAAALTPR
jgi:hypothetical protein